MSLQDLPPELTERVVLLLPLPDISSLRLTNKCLALKVAQRHLKASFRTKRVELTEQRLHSFVAITASGGLGCLLQDLTLVVPVYNTSALAARLKNKSAQFPKLNEDGGCYGILWRDLTEVELRQTELDLVALQDKSAQLLNFQRQQRDLQLLNQAFSNLAAHGASLHVLRGEVEIYQDDTTTPLLPMFGGQGHPIWASAAQLVLTSFRSLAACGLPVQSLDLFNSIRMQCCSLSCSELGSVDFGSVGLISSLSHLVELSLRISDRHVRDQTHQTFDEEPLENFDGLRSLLRSCSSIRKLDLAIFSRVYVKEQNAQHGRIIRTLGESEMRRLECLTLQGFVFTEHELLTSLRGFGALRSLSLRFINLKDGSFKPVFDYCTIEAAMEEMELDDLFENVMVEFEPPWVVHARPSILETKSGAIHPGLRASYRRPSHDATSYQIKYHRRGGRSMDTPSTRAWNQVRKNRFGPLPGTGKPSCLQPYFHVGQLWRSR